MTDNRKMRTVLDGKPFSGPRLIHFLQLERDYLDARDKLAIGVRLKETRKQAGYTEREMGDMLTPPVTDRTIRNWEAGEGRFLGYLRQWAECTSTTYEYLLRGGDAPVDLGMADLHALLEEVAEMVARGFELLGVPPDELRRPSDGPRRTGQARRRATS